MRPERRSEAGHGRRPRPQTVPSLPAPQPAGVAHQHQGRAGRAGWRSSSALVTGSALVSPSFSVSPGCGLFGGARRGRAGISQGLCAGRAGAATPCSAPRGPRPRPGPRLHAGGGGGDDGAGALAEVGRAPELGRVVVAHVAARRHDLRGPGGRAQAGRGARSAACRASGRARREAAQAGHLAACSSSSSSSASRPSAAPQATQHPAPAWRRRTALGSAPGSRAAARGWSGRGGGGTPPPGCPSGSTCRWRGRR